MTDPANALHHPALIGAGVFVLVIAIWQYWRTVRHLWSASFAALAGVTEQRM
jgi:hypothetical protein